MLKVNPFWVKFPCRLYEVLGICWHLLQIRQYMCYFNDLAACVTEILFPYFNSVPNFFSCQRQQMVIPRDLQYCLLYGLGSADTFTATAEIWLPAARCLQLRSCLCCFVMLSESARAAPCLSVCDNSNNAIRNFMEFADLRENWSFSTAVLLKMRRCAFRRRGSSRRL
jgi:hypothetical protein